MGDFIAKDNIPVDGVLAYSRGQVVTADAVKTHGWEDLVVGAGTKEAGLIHADIIGVPAVPDTTTKSRAAAAITEPKG